MFLRVAAIKALLDYVAVILSSARISALVITGLPGKACYKVRRLLFSQIQ